MSRVRADPGGSEDEGLGFCSGLTFGVWMSVRRVRMRLGFGFGFERSE